MAVVYYIGSGHFTLQKQTQTGCAWNVPELNAKKQIILYEANLYYSSPVVVGNDGVGCSIDATAGIAKSNKSGGSG